MTLATLGDYRALTGDATTADATVEALLPVAQGLLEIELGRVGLLELGTHVETLDVWRGYVYPNATPIDPATPGYVSPGKFRPVGASLVAWPGSSCWSELGPVIGEGRATVSYSGGYDETTAPYPLKLAIAKITQELTPRGEGLLAAAPAGTKSITVGDVSITLARALGTSVIPFDVLPLVQAYRIVDAAQT